MVRSASSSALPDREVSQDTPEENERITSNSHLKSDGEVADSSRESSASRAAKRPRVDGPYFAREESTALSLKFAVALEETKSQLAGLDPDHLKKIPKIFRTVEFKGKTRPAMVTRRMPGPRGAPEPDHARTGVPKGELREERSGGPIHVHTPEELMRVRKACRVGREVLDVAGHFLRAGVTGDEIDRVVYKACEERGAYPSPLNYYDFPKSFCISRNDVICHGIPDCRPVKEGDIVNLDVSVYVDGMHADLNETFLIGKREADEFSVEPEGRVSVPEENRSLVKVAYESLRAASKMIKPGTFYRDLGGEITRVAHAHEFAVVRAYSGHGTGHLFHALPTIPHYARNKAIGIMRPGHVFTIEPMLNAGGIDNWGDRVWPDNWTVVTKNGKASAQFEHTFLVTETGCEILTARRGCSRTEMPPWEEIENHMWR